ncbi:MAG: hypothetical protein QOK28_3283 [Actinomycetota bacterium]
MIEDGLPAAPVHHGGRPHEMHRSGPPLSDDELAALVTRVRASAVKTTSASLDALPDGIESISLAAWAADFPTDIAVLRRSPWEARADSVMYRQVLDDLARQRGWDVHLYDPKTVEAEAARIVGSDVLAAPRKSLGPPWTKDHRVALAATIVVG